ncbi:MAG: CpXC domain-containing protein [Chloroflexota bacterium]
MQTQVSCPQCGTNFPTEVHQVVDSKRTPQLKQALLNNQLNVAQCPSCGFQAQLSTLLLFHDPEYEVFMVHVPQQLNLNTEQREQMIGQMAQQVMNALPQEDRRAYMFQPEIMLNYQTFMERVLETEGITKEMIARQKEQSELLRKLAQADGDVMDYLIQENMKLFDDEFFSMMQLFLDQSLQMQDSKSAANLTNLRAKLMEKTPAGQEMQRRQIALHKFNQEGKKQGGLSPQLLLDHMVANIDDFAIIDGLVAAGQQAMTYDFFTMMTTEIENRQKDNDTATAEKLTQLRDRLLEFQKAMRAESEKMLGEANQVIQAILHAPDKKQAIADNMGNIDDTFMYVLSAQMQEAQQAGDKEMFKGLAEIQAVLMTLIESQLPPDIQMLNQLVRAESEAEQNAILDTNAPLIKPELLQMMDRVIAQAKESGQSDQEARLTAIKGKIAARVG